MPDALHERSDKEIRDKLSSGEISDKKASTARAILRRRRQERWQAWFKRHEWLATLLTALGLAGIFSIRRSASDGGPGSYLLERTKGVCHSPDRERY